MDANMQLTISSFTQHFPDEFSPDISLIFSKIPDISLTAVKFPDISRFSKQVVTLNITENSGKQLKKTIRTQGQKSTLQKPYEVTTRINMKS